MKNNIFLKTRLNKSATAGRFIIAFRFGK